MAIACTSHWAPVSALRLASPLNKADDTSGRAWVAGSDLVYNTAGAHALPRVLSILMPKPVSQQQQQQQCDLENDRGQHKAQQSNDNSTSLQNQPQQQQQTTLTEPRHQQCEHQHSKDTISAPHTKPCRTPEQRSCSAQGHDEARGRSGPVMIYVHTKHR